VLAGVVSLLALLLDKFPDVLRQFPSRDAFVDFLTFEGLFKKEKRVLLSSEDHRPPPLCKSEALRAACLELLRVLASDSLGLKLRVAQYVKQNLCNETYWRTPKKADWSI